MTFAELRAALVNMPVRVQPSRLVQPTRAQRLARMLARHPRHWS